RPAVPGEAPPEEEHLESRSSPISLSVGNGLQRRWRLDSVTCGHDIRDSAIEGRHRSQSEGDQEKAMWDPHWDARRYAGLAKTHHKLHHRERLPCKVDEHSAKHEVREDTKGDLYRRWKDLEQYVDLQVFGSGSDDDDACHDDKDEAKDH